MNNSRSQLLLRILTGKHAGAELSLVQGRYEIGTHIGCDVVISDCTVESANLIIDDQDRGSIISETDQVTSEVRFLVNQPLKLGGVVIVFFNPVAIGNRPTDLNLLQQLLAPQPPTVIKTSVANRWVAVISAFSVLVIGCGIVLQSSGSTAATRGGGKSENVLLQVNKILSDSRFLNVHALEDHKSVVVTGLVHNRDEKENLAALLQNLQSGAIRHQYAVETEVIAAITDAIALPGIVVTHVGNGRFNVSGDVPDAVQKKSELKRLKTDLSSVISEIMFVVKKAEPTTDIDGMSQAAGGYQFRLAPDGVKYFMSK